MTVVHSLNNFSSKCIITSSSITIYYDLLSHVHRPDTRQGTVIYTVTATDDDIISPFNDVTYSIEQGIDNSDQMFSINSRGQVSIRGALSNDNSEVSVYVLLCTCQTVYSYTFIAECLWKCFSIRSHLVKFSRHGLNCHPSVLKLVIFLSLLLFLRHHWTQN